jgi:large subunit ribosomal protein L25
MKLIATKRNIKETAKLRSAGKLPGVVYGPQLKSQPIVLELNPFVKLYNSAGESTLIDFQLDGLDPLKVLIQDVQLDPVTGSLIHVDLRQIDMNKEIEADVLLHFDGEAPALKAGGTLVKNLDKIKIKCLPKYLISSVSVDLSVLNSFDDVIYVKDLIVPPEVKVLTHSGEIVVKAVPVQEEKEEAVPVSVADIKVVGKEEKKEGEEGTAEATGAQQQKE